MPPGRGGGGEHGCTMQGHPPATGSRGLDHDAPPHPPSPFPATDISPQMKKQKKEHEQQQPMGSLSEGPLVEILSRVPYKSLCHFKCVSKPWLALCSDPEIRKRFPQTLTGFFYNTSSSCLSFCNVSGRGAPMVDPSLPFLRGRYEHVRIQQCSGGLLLCRYCESYKGRKKKKNKYGYAACNPATGEWIVLPVIVLPDPEDGVPVIHDPNDLFLAFDASDDPYRFLVFAPLCNGYGEFAQVAVFSSESRRWTAVYSHWVFGTVLLGGPQCSLFLNGTMHLTTHRGSVVTIDKQCETWREVDMADGMVVPFEIVCIGQSQGRLHGWRVDNDNDPQLYVWVLEDYGTGKWTLKHNVHVSKLFGRRRDEDDRSYRMIAIHPDCDMVFLTDSEEMTVSYDIDTQKVHVICTSGEFLDGAPYIPCFTKLSSGSRRKYIAAASCT